MNIYPDLSKDAVKLLGTLKALTGDDVINVQRKFGHPFKLANKAVLCFSANELPSVQDSTWAFWRRWCVIPFPHTFTKDPNFTKKMFSDDNLSAFLKLVIEKMNRMEKYGLSNSARVEQAKILWQERSNSVHAFIKECIVNNSEAFIKKDELYNLYLVFCEEKDITAQDIKVLSQELIKKGIVLDRVTINQQRVYVYKGCEYSDIHTKIDKQQEVV
jgi:putative DNA primase/helicase